MPEQPDLPQQPVPADDLAPLVEAPAPPPVDDGDDEPRSHRLPERLSPVERGNVVIKFSHGDRLLELIGDDVDLGTDLKVRHEHGLVAEFRRDAVDGWWFRAAEARAPYRVDDHHRDDDSDDDS